MSRFPEDFTWGVATSAYQIEGGRETDKGESIWDRFAHQPGRTHQGAHGDIACDHFNRWQEDVALMAELGVDAYRFSIAWTRVIPEGTGAISAAGLGFYDRLVDALLEHGITPYPTLYHWDLPQPLEDAGGWPERKTVDAFVHYADAVTSALGDRVQHWITHNEPWVASMVGYRDGIFAPGRADWGDALAAAHHLLLSHGKAVPVIRANVPAARVGIALDCRPAKPASSSEADAAAHRHFDGFRNRWFFDPVFGKGYPEDMLAAYARLGRVAAHGPSFVREGDLEAIAVPIDFIGLNYYTSLEIAAGGEESENTGVQPGPNPLDGYTEMGWEITPDALSGYLRHLTDTYRPTSIIITENGASYSDAPGGDGRIHDQRRIDYLDGHMRAVAEARDGGVPVDGYFVWSFLDNFEWALGYSQRFGIVWVDFETGRRIPKDSYFWLQERLAVR